MCALYKYPQQAFPYAELLAENRRRGRSDPEFELLDSGVFADNREVSQATRRPLAGTAQTPARLALLCERIHC
jgi:hypothetical protein